LTEVEMADPNQNSTPGAQGLTGNDGALDLSDEKSDAVADDVEIKPYDSRPQEDGARRNIAYALIALLFFVVVWALAAVTFGCAGTNQENITKLVQMLLSPIVALVSAATGFYYGSKTVK
jgi:hypothetical protein